MQILMIFGLFKEYLQYYAAMIIDLCNDYLQYDVMIIV
jgi:hypothetical protein